MTNKLPVVGKRYKEKYTGKIVKCVIASFNSPLILKFETDDGEEVSFNLTMWERLFEELPEDKAETKPETQNNHFPDVGKMVLSPEVKEAMEELKSISLKGTLSNQYYHEHYKEMRDKVDNLLNALDKQFNQPSESVAVKEEPVGFARAVQDSSICGFDENGEAKHLVRLRIGETEEKEESIWKPVSELPESSEDTSVFIKFSDGENEMGYVSAGKRSIRSFVDNGAYFKEQVVGFTTVSDFINDYEKLKEIVKKLEKNNA